MPKSVVIRMACERCKTVWYDDWDPEKKDADEPASLTIKLTLPGKKGEQLHRNVHYGVLCEGCQQTVSNYIDGIDKSKAKKDGAKEEGASKDPLSSNPAEQSSTSGGRRVSARGLTRPSS
jgi:hypothetical protein